MLPRIGLAGSGSARMTTCPNRSTSLSWSCGSGRWPDENPPLSPVSSKQPTSSSTLSAGPPPGPASLRQLTTKEFAVLEALLRASPATLSAEDLLEQAWDEHTDPFTKTVQVTIGRLRRKLGDPDVIQTIPGVGYRIT